MVTSLLVFAALHLAPSPVGVRADASASVLSGVSDRKGRERGILAPSEITLPARTASLGSDELIWLKFSMGLTDRLQLSVSGIAVPFPFAGGAVLPLGGIVALGGAGVGVAGAFDLGVKYRLLDESAVLPGLAVGYDLVDGYIAGAGVGAAAAIGNGAGAGVVPTIGLVNAQLNVFSLVAGKHFGAAHVMAGAYVIDNHNVLPQSASFGAVIFGTGSGVTTTGGAEQFSRLPTQVVPFVAVDYRLGARASLLGELFVRNPLAGSFGSTGARWVIREKGEARFRIDAAAVWMYFPPDNSVPSGPRPWMVLPQPWVSMAVYFG